MRRAAALFASLFVTACIVRSYLVTGPERLEAFAGVALGLALLCLSELLGRASERQAKIGAVVTRALAEAVGKLPTRQDIDDLSGAVASLPRRVADTVSERQPPEDPVLGERSP